MTTSYATLIEGIRDSRWTANELKRIFDGFLIPAERRLDAQNAVLAAATSTTFVTSVEGDLTVREGDLVFGIASTRFSINTTTTTGIAQIHKDNSQLASYEKELKDDSGATSGNYCDVTIPFMEYISTSGTFQYGLEIQRSAGSNVVYFIDGHISAIALRAA